MNLIMTMSFTNDVKEIITYCYFEIKYPRITARVFGASSDELVGNVLNLDARTLSGADVG